MPSRLFAIDTNFPTFTGEESPVEQIKLLHNYMFQLQESLQYTLQNLTVRNFNTKGLEQLTEETQKQIAELLTSLSTRLDIMSSTANTNIARLWEDMEAVRSAIEDEGGLWEQAEKAAQDIQGLKNQLEGTEEAPGVITRLEVLEQLLEGTEETPGILARLETAEQTLAKMSSVIQVAEDGTVTLGSAESTLHLNGKIYINGELYGGNADETA